MKKLFNILLIGIISLLVLPIMVGAETKTFEDVKYTIEEKTIEEYICSNVKNHEYSLAHTSSVGIIIYDKTDDKYYEINFANRDVCTEFDGNYFEDYDYRWGANNTVYEEEYDYSVLDDWAYVAELDGEYPFSLARDTYNSEETYYEINDDSEAILVTNKNEADFNAEKYYTLLEPKTKTLVATFKTTNLVAPKEKTGLQEDIAFIKSDMLYAFKFDGKYYFVFKDMDGDPQYTAIFDEEGNYQTFGQNQLLVSGGGTSIEGDYLMLSSYEDSKEITMIIDKYYNVVLKTEISASELTFVGKNGQTDYLANTAGMELKVLEITQTKIDTKIPNTYDGVTTQVVIGIIALIGLGLSILYIKRKKAN